jgi:hypothetical protein
MIGNLVKKKMKKNVSKKSKTSTSKELFCKSCSEKAVIICPECRMMYCSGDTCTLPSNGIRYCRTCAEISE